MVFWVSKHGFRHYVAGSGNRWQINYASPGYSVGCAAKLGGIFDSYEDAYNVLCDYANKHGWIMEEGELTSS
jgi:hypothetical protein